MIQNTFLQKFAKPTFAETAYLAEHLFSIFGYDWFEESEYSDKEIAHTEEIFKGFNKDDFSIQPLLEVTCEGTGSATSGVFLLKHHQGEALMIEITDPSIEFFFSVVGYLPVDLPDDTLNDRILDGCVIVEIMVSAGTCTSIWAKNRTVAKDFLEKAIERGIIDPIEFDLPENTGDAKALSEQLTQKLYDSQRFLFD